MAYSAVPLPRFTGLRLNDDAQDVGWNGAVTGINFDIDHSGRVRTRDGFTKFSTYTATTGYTSIAQNSAGVFVVADGNTVRELPGSDTRVMTAGYSPPSLVRAPPTGNVVIANGVDQLYAYSGSTFVLAIHTVNGVAGNSPKPRLIAITPNSDRMAAAGFVGTADGPGGAASSSSPSHIYFSGAGNYGTWQTADRLELAPGDGEEIRALCTWQNYLFVFKETKFFVFYGETTDAAGDTEFNYRTVEGIGISGAGYQPQLAVAGKDGVYFANQKGVYVTNGGPAKKISDNIAPLFRGSPSYNEPGLQGAPYISMSTDVTLYAPIALGFHDDRLFLSYSTSNTTTPSLTFVYDTRSGEWMLWDVAPYSFTVASQSGVKMLHITARLTPGASNVHYLDPSAGWDTVADIQAHYQTGYADLGSPGAQKVVREWLVDGNGAVEFSVLHSDYADDEQTAVTESLSLGTPKFLTGLAQVRRDRMRKAVRGTNFALRFETNPAQPTDENRTWDISRVIAHVRAERPAGMSA